MKTRNENMKDENTRKNVDVMACFDTSPGGRYSQQPAAGGFKDV
ncbi:MAG: hypothetical protein ACM36C_11385 [Acidobacteriota bacterium]